MIKELVKDKEILSARCERATPEDVSIAQDLIDTLASIEDGACLAANQIGITKQIGVYLDKDKKDEEKRPHVLYNPHLMMGLGAKRGEETCLSHEENSTVTRYTKVKVSFDELVDGEFVERRHDFTGWTAQMVQHIIDHCQGKLV